MNILGIQMFGIVFGLLFLYITFINRKKNQLNVIEGTFWSSIWIALIVFSFFPRMLNFIVQDILNISRLLDFLIIMSIMVMFGIIYYIFITTKKTQNKVEQLVREIALEKNKKNFVLNKKG